MPRPTDVDNITIDDVESLETTGWNHLQESKKEDLLEDAIRERNTIYTGRFSRLPSLDGDPVIFVMNLAAHKWELSEGGEPSSESQAGGQANYNGSAGEDYLMLTRYGKTALRHLRSEQQIAIVRTRR